MVLVPGDSPAREPVTRAEPPWPHIVQFYETSDGLCDAVAEFLAAGASAGEPLVVIATESHRLALLQRLAGAGAGADLTLFDAEETLAQFMVDGALDPARFDEVVGGALRDVERRRPGVPIRAYGEMVDVLWQRGQKTVALELEELWNQLRRRQSFTLYCAYVMGAFYKEGDRDAICAAHDREVPPAHAESGSRELQAEIAERARVEHALRSAVRELVQARDEIARSRRHLEEFLDQAPLGIHWVAPDGTILWANRAELEMLGYESGEYVGRHIAELHADRENIEDMLAQLARGETLIDREARMIARDGGIRHVLVNSNVHRVDGAFVHTRCFTRDVTVARAAAGALRLRERQVETIADSLPTLVSFVDAAGRYQFVNQRYVEWFGDRTGIVGRHIEHVIGAAAFAVIRPHVEAALGGRAVSFEQEIPFPSGTRFVDATHVPHRDGDGAVVGFTALISDITERKREEAAREATGRQRQRLLAVTAAIAEAVSREEVFEAVVDQASAALDASSAGLFLLEGGTVRLVRQVGYNADAVPTMDGLPLAGSARIPSLDVIRDGEPMWLDSQSELLTRYPHLGAHVTPTRSYRIACLPIGSNGQTIGSLAFTFDDAPALDDNQKSFLLLVTRYCGQALERLRLLEAERHSRRQADEARRRAELLHQLARAIILAERAEDVYDAALGTIARGLGAERSAVLLLDDDGVMRFVAHRGLSDGYRSAVEGHSPWAADERDPQPVLVPDVSCDPALAGFLPLFASESIGALGFFPLVASGRLLGKFMVYHAGARDFAPLEVDLAMAIANHVGAAVVRFRAVGELESTVRFNELFTGILGHDLRNPLQAIMTAANVALLRGEGDRQLKPITRILLSGERMSRMIDQLLDFTRVRTGAGIPIDVRPVDLSTLVRQVADELEDAHPESSFALETVGDTVGSWDPDRLAQVFSNLIGNAVQHASPGAGVQIRVDGTDRARVRVDVHNQGAIPRELLPRVFEPMSGGEIRRARSNGLGLGLFITEQIARAHGGAVSVQSSEEEGTTFSVSLPRLHGAPEPRDRDGGTR